MKLKEILRNLDVGCLLDDGATTWDADNLLSDADVRDDDSEYVCSCQGIHKIGDDGNSIVYPPVFSFESN